MDIQIYDLPTVDAGTDILEKKYCEVLNRYRRGEKLAIEVVDWLDYANNILITSERI